MCRGLEHRGHVDELTKVYDAEELRAAGGVIDYVVAAQPNTGSSAWARTTTRSSATT